MPLVASSGATKGIDVKKLFLLFLKLFL